MHCHYCFRKQLRDIEPEPGWEIVSQCPVCPDCRERARAEHGPGWISRMRGGCYAGGRIDPRLFNPPPLPAEVPPLSALIDRFGPPTIRPLDKAAGDFGQIVYHPSVPQGMAILFGGWKAGQSAVIYFDAHAHLEGRIAPAIRRRMPEIDDALLAAQMHMHAKIDEFADRLGTTLLENHPRYTVQHYTDDREFPSLLRGGVRV